MRKLAALLAFTITTGATFCRAGELETLRTSFDLGSIKLSGIRSAGFSGGQPTPEPGLILPRPPRLGTSAAQTITFQSGRFQMSEVQERLDEAVRQLTAAGCTVIRSNRDWTEYDIVFTAPTRARVRKYASGQYDGDSTANAAMELRLTSLKQSGIKVILEARREDARFVISYLENL